MGDTPPRSNEVEEPARGPVAVYQTVAVSLIAGLLRLTETDLVCAQSALALAALNSASPPISMDRVDPRLREVVEGLQSIGYGAFDSYRYVTRVSLLVYATALFDTFLTDTATFLLALHPGALGSAQAIPVEDLFKAASKFEAITQAIRRRARSLAFETFLQRLEFLNRTFGFSVHLDPEERAALENCSSLRNAVVHDQGSFAIELSDTGQVTLRQKACLRHPTPVSSQEYGAALKTYREVSHKVYSGVMEKVLKVPADPLYATLRRALLPPQSGQLTLLPPVAEDT